ILEAILDTDAALRGCADDVRVWGARGPQVDWAGAVGVGVVAEDTDGWAADRRSDMHGPRIYHHRRARLRKRARQLRHRRLAAPVDQRGLIQQLLLPIAGVVALALDLWLAADQPYAELARRAPTDHFAPVLWQPLLCTARGGHVQQYVRYVERRRRARHLGNVESSLDVADSAKDLGQVIAAQNLLVTLEEVRAVPVAVAQHAIANVLAGRQLGAEVGGGRRAAEVARRHGRPPHQVYLANLVAVDR